MDVYISDNSVSYFTEHIIPLNDSTYKMSHLKLDKHVI